MLKTRKGDSEDRHLVEQGGRAQIQLFGEQNKQFGKSSQHSSETNRKVPNESEFIGSKVI